MVLNVPYQINVANGTMQMMMMMKIYKSPSFISSTEPIALIAQTGKAWLAEIVTSEYFTYFKPANVAGHKDLS